MEVFLKLRLILFPFLLLLSCGNDPSYNTDGKVHIKKNKNGYTLIRNNEPFDIRGVAGHKRLQLLKKIGGNTIRTYDTVGLQQILDNAHQNDLTVIAGLVLPKSKEDWFYKNDSLIDLYDQNLQKVAAKYKDHPALLMWCLGNEPIFYSFSNFRFSSAYNRFLKTLRSTDPDHPVTMALANFSDREILNIRFKIPNLDVLMINTFGRLPELENDMKIYGWLWNGPFIVGEFGVSGPWETDRTAWHAPLEPNDMQKARRLKEMYHELPHENPRFLGAIAFYWGQRQEVTHTWFNFLSEDNKVNQTVLALSELWGNPLDGNKPPNAVNLQIDASSEYNRFLFNKNSEHTASVELDDPDGDSLRVEWTLRPEDWLFEKMDAPDPIEASFIFFNKDSTFVRFRAPHKPGPYRLFVKVTDDHENFAVTNYPFYVVQ